MYVGEVGVGHGFRILSVSVAFVKAAFFSSQPCGLLLLPYRQAVAHGQPLSLCLITALLYVLLSHECMCQK